MYIRAFENLSFGLPRKKLQPTLEMLEHPYVGVALKRKMDISKLDEIAPLVTDPPYETPPLS